MNDTPPVRRTPERLRPSLPERVRERVRADGPLTISAFMAEALYDPQDGYYATKDPIGAGADFITAPEISQMFGELLGLWAVQSWMDLGEPHTVRLIELGPGRGAMMADALRAARVSADFLTALTITLVEASPALQAVQARTLAEAPVLIGWERDTPRTGAEPAVILANEFLDCLPIRQFIKLSGAWRERLVGVSPEEPEALAFTLSPLPAPARDVALIPAALRDADEGALVEIRPGAGALLDAIAARLTAHGGRALFIDYGPANSEIGDTFQAVRGHQKLSPLTLPGSVDLTARVDFAEFVRLARERGLEVHGPVEQGAWLARLGLEQRAIGLIRQDEERKRRIATQVFRLTDPSQMGALFKVLCLSSPGLPPPAGFEG